MTYAESIGFLMKSVELDKSEESIVSFIKVFKPWIKEVERKKFIENYNYSFYEGRMIRSTPIRSIHILRLRDDSRVDVGYIPHFKGSRKRVLIIHNKPTQIKTDVLILTTEWLNLDVNDEEQPNNSFSYTT